MEVNGDSELNPSWRDNIYTIPNVISIARLGAVPIFVWLLLGEERRLSAALLLGILGATDWVDGWIARRFDQVSDCLLYTSPSPRDRTRSRMPSSA